MESGERAKEVLSNHLPFLDDNCNLEIDDILERLSKLDGMVASKTNTIPRFKRDFYALKQTIINNTLDNKWTKAVTIFKEKRAANEEYYFFIFITSKGGNYPFRLPVKKCPSLRRLYIHLETIDYERENIVKAKDGITMNELYNAYNALWLHWHWFINNVNNLHKN